MGALLPVMDLNKLTSQVVLISATWKESPKNNNKVQQSGQKITLNKVLIILPSLSNIFKEVIWHQV